MSSFGTLLQVPAINRTSSFNVVGFNSAELPRQLCPAPSLGRGYLLEGQWKMWISVAEEDVERLGLRSVYGHRHWEQNWVVICTDLASNRNF